MTKTRDDAALATIKIRMREPLRSEIERAATRNGCSMNAEMVTRLSRSFIEEKAAGGPELRRIAYIMAAAFGSRGCAYAAANGRSAEPSHWMNDSASYRAATIAVIEALLAQYPGNPSPDHGALNDDPVSGGSFTTEALATIRSRGEPHDHHVIVYDQQGKILFQTWHSSYAGLERQCAGLRARGAVFTDKAPQNSARP